MSIRAFRRRRGRRIGAAARAMAHAAPETLTVVRRRAQPTAVTMARLAGTAVFAYLVALPLPVSPHPVLAPLTALLVVQVSLYQTLSSAVRRVAAVVAGVVLAVGLSAWIGFTWWSLGVAIVVALGVGCMLRLGDSILEVPISAMLILSVAGAREAATGRIIETLVGAAAGLVAGLVFAQPQVESAAEAIQDLCRKVADLLDQMAAGVADGFVLERSEDWLAQARALGGEIERVDDALRQAEDSLRLNPRGLRLQSAPISLRSRLETLEHAAITLRGLARSLADSLRLARDDSPMHDPEARDRLASVLAHLAAAVRTFGSLAVVTGVSAQEQLTAELEQDLAAAQDQQDRLGEVLATDPAVRPVGWPLRGELISHLDRLRSELRAAGPTAAQRPRRVRSWWRSLSVGRWQHRSPTRRRRKA